MKEAINFVEFIQKDFIKATRKDIDNYRYYLKKTSIQERARIKQDKWKKLSKNKSGRNPYANNRITKKTYIGQYSIEMYCNIIKRFYLWLYNRDNLIKGEVPHLVSHLQKTKYMENIKKIDPSEVLTTEDIKNMVESCRHIRDKCFISLLYESGARIGELLACNIGSYDDKGQYAYVKLVGKTGTRIPDIIHSLPYIRKWNNEHKYKDDKNALLFVSFTTIIKMEGYLREVVMIFLEILLNELDVNF
jgi:site-specific recombinase XerD